MGYPTDTDYPGALDSLEDRTDNVDIVWADDFDFQAKQVQKLQSFLGQTGKMIGENIAGAGPNGMVSPVADGGTALRLVARNAFTSGTILSVEDDFDGVAQQKMRLDFAGTLWAYGGLDISDTDFLHVPKGGTFPAGLGAGDEGRLYYKTGADIGLYAFDGSTWLPQSGTWEGYIDAASDYSYTLAATPVEEVVGQFVFDGSRIAPGLQAAFRALVTATFAAAGTANVRFYDLGPAAGPPTAPRLITTLSTTSSSLTYLGQILTVVSAGATGGEILDAARMYEITLEITGGTTGDTIYLGSAGLKVEMV